MDFKLKSLHKDATFYVCALLSLPAIISAYQLLLEGKHVDTMSLLATPLALYLGIGKQYARGKAIDAASINHHIAPVESNPSVDEDLTEALDIPEFMRSDMETIEDAGE